MRRYCLFISLLIITGLLWTGCLNIYFVARNKYPNDFVVHKINPRTPLFGEPKKLKLYLAPQMTTEPDSEETFTLRVMQKTRKEDLILKTSKGNSLSLLIDGERFEFETVERIYGESGIYSSEYPLWRHRRYDDSLIIIEQVSYGATLEIFEKIANAKKVEVILRGEDKRSVQKKFLEAHFVIFKKFVKYAKKKMAS